MLIQMEVLLVSKYHLLAHFRYPTTIFNMSRFNNFCHLVQMLREMQIRIIELTSRRK